MATLHCSVKGMVMKICSSRQSYFMRVVICLFVFAQSDRERSPVAKKIRLFIHSQNFSSHLTVRLPVCLYHRESNVNCHSLWLVWEPATWYCTYMLWWIDSCQNRASTDRIYWYWSVSHDYVVGLVVDPSWTGVFFKFSAEKVLILNWWQAHFFAMVTK